MTVGDMLWYKPTGNPGPLAAIVCKVNWDSDAPWSAWTVNVYVLDSGDSVLTDALGATIKHDVAVRATYAEACGGECSLRDMGG
jgi:hypothetical protein